MFGGIRVLQITNPISPGSSGGGLFDKQGNLVGLTTFKLARGENLNFAIPAEYLQRIDRARDAAMFVWMFGSSPGSIAMPPEVGDRDYERLRQAFETKRGDIASWLVGKQLSLGPGLADDLLKALNQLRVSDPKSSEFASAVRLARQTFVEYERAVVADSTRPAPSGDAPRFTCRLVSENNKSYDSVISPDVDRRQVQEFFPKRTATYAAEVTETTMSWRVGPYTYQLNRFTGDIQLGNEEVPRLFVGRCTKLEGRLF
jgi:hypothetical protein